MRREGGEGAPAVTSATGYVSMFLQRVSAAESRTGTVESTAGPGLRVAFRALDRHPPTRATLEAERGETGSNRLDRWLVVRSRGSTALRRGTAVSMRLMSPRSSAASL